MTPVFAKRAKKIELRFNCFVRRDFNRNAWSLKHALLEKKSRSQNIVFKKETMNGVGHPSLFHFYCLVSYQCQNHNDKQKGMNV